MDTLNDLRRRCVIDEKPDSCWIFNKRDIVAPLFDGSKNKKKMTARRAALLLSLEKPVPQDCSVICLCGNKWCVRPEHIGIYPTTKYRQIIAEKGRRVRLQRKVSI